MAYSSALNKHNKATKAKMKRFLCAFTETKLRLNF